jgi:hypothetical protein
VVADGSGVVELPHATRAMARAARTTRRRTAPLREPGSRGEILVRIEQRLGMESGFDLDTDVDDV